MDLSKYIIPSDANIREAIKKLDKGGRGILCVEKDGGLLGIVTDGDFRRAVLNGINMNDSVDLLVNRQFRFITDSADESEIEEMFLKYNIRHLPVLKDGALTDIIFEEEFFIKKKESNYKVAKSLNIPVVLMAGGKGTRLVPFTDILPKPLIPINGKPIIEIIIAKFTEYGIKDFFISVNHKGKMIKVYFEDISPNYNVTFIDEPIPLGTGGALKYLEGKIDSPFFVSNCDIVINADYTDIYKFHKEGNFDFTLVGSLQHHVIPYGVCKMENGGTLIDIDEKPVYDIIVNTGLYLLNPDILRYIPDGKFYNITELIMNLKELGKKVGIYPVSAKSWIDIGQWDEYRNALASMSF